MMLIYKARVVFLGCLITLKSFGCDCKSFSQASEFDHSEYVLIGRINEVIGDEFSVVVLERLKGDPTDTISFMVDDCSIVAEQGDVWLLFALSGPEGKYHASLCGYSRSFDEPITLQGLTRMPNQNVTLGEIATKLDRIIAHEKLSNDIFHLRKLRDLDQSSSDILINPTHEEAQTPTFIKIGIVAIVTLLTSILLLLLTIYRQRA